MACPQHPAIFWHSCGNFRSGRGPLQILPCRSRYENWTWHVFCTSSKKGLENRSSRFDPKISWICFSRGSGPPLIHFVKHLFNISGFQIWNRSSKTSDFARLDISDVRSDIGVQLQAMSDFGRSEKNKGEKGSIQSVGTVVWPLWRAAGSGAKAPPLATRPGFLWSLPPCTGL